MLLQWNVVQLQKHTFLKYAMVTADNSQQFFAIGMLREYKNVRLASCTSTYKIQGEK